MARNQPFFRCAAVGLLALLGAIVAAPPALAIEPWRIVVRVQGRVESLEPGQTSWAPIFRSRRLNDGASARTLTESVANINLADQSSFRIGPNSEVEMTKFELTPQGRTIVFTLRAGKVQADVARLLGKQSRFEVKTPNGVLAARGTQFSVTVMKESELRSLQQTESRPQASIANVDGVDLLAQNDPYVTLVAVHEGTVTGRAIGVHRAFNLQPGDRAILGVQTLQINPPHFPQVQLIPPNRRAPSIQTQRTEQQANNFQDTAHRQRMSDQFTRQYNHELGAADGRHGGTTGPAGGDGGVNNNAIGGTTVGGTPPLFNPTNTQNPLTNTLNSGTPAPGGTSGTSTTSGTGGTHTAPTGRVLIIIQ